MSAVAGAGGVGGGADLSACERDSGADAGGAVRRALEQLCSVDFSLELPQKDAGEGGVGEEAGDRVGEGEGLQKLRKGSAEESRSAILERAQQFLNSRS